MKLSKIDLYYFSGTGNTYLVVREMKETFEKSDVEVELHKIEDSDPQKINLSHTVGLGFPVAELSTYEFVWDFINALPKANGTQIFMVDTLGGFSGGIVGPVRKIVEKKGYTPLGACEIIMPPNVFYIQDGNTNKKKVKKGLNRAEKYANSILNGRSKWGRVPVISDAIYYTSIVGLKLTETKLNQRMFYLNTNKEVCSRCGTCVELCPVDNVIIGEDGYPENLMHCHYCLRCTSFCPRNAISCPLNYKGKTYQAIKNPKVLKRKKY